MNEPFVILLVDDREENLLSLEEMLTQEGRSFLRALSGNEALKLVLKNPHIGLILLDVQMPDMDGFEVAKILKSNPRTKDISIIFVTAINKEQQYVLKGFDEGAVDYLQKPLDIRVTQAKVLVFEQLHRYQARLKTTAEALKRTNKQLENFVYMVAHDLKSPLNGIFSMLSMIEMRGQDGDLASEELQEYLDLAKKASFHLSGMISEILDYSRKSLAEQTVEEVDVQEMVSQIFQLLFPPKHIRTVINNEMPRFRTRKLKLQQVFQNLISNAIKYNDKAGGLVEVGYEDPGGDFYRYYVRDNGPGVSMEDREALFKLFAVTETPSRTENKTGVGLNIIKILVEEQGGKIWVESTPGEGSTFYFEWRK
ncbi:sensor histidine kinase [Siphonobacter aquaeclarae]|jgi:two-component system sensor histidine kinase/response regulator|uniref:histidine kinase n=1 Tax=Siphonobacter aquaeclarae TaxID=563176 RepID=A0A1G9L6K3_9BACT|nr:ATP-binding protein [Siphonobacter aquaeclarae]MBO9638732.1 response regulator [Siphonobacter aquaeclarae]SDL57581.1 His Kinase A (phospho-acceptor) domain-containing protein [Siphonobacter aquaeclarae]